MNLYKNFTFLFMLFSQIPLISSFALHTGRFFTPSKILRAVPCTTRPRTNLVAKSTPTSIPSIDELSADPFMKQLSHASNLVPLLNNEESMDHDILLPLLKAQLSHSDGIRGFFAQYLTGEGTTAAADDEVPSCLVDAMNSVENGDELISLACMNAIMPTAMITMHEDPELSKASKQTARRGKKILKSLLHKTGTKKQCLAILDVATTSNASSIDEKDKNYWEKFFLNWGYEQTQKADIAKAMTEILLE